MKLHSVRLAVPRLAMVFLLAAGVTACRTRARKPVATPTPSPSPSPTPTPEPPSPYSAHAFVKPVLSGPVAVPFAIAKPGEAPERFLHLATAEADAKEVVEPGAIVVPSSVATLVVDAHVARPLAIPLHADGRKGFTRGELLARIGGAYAWLYDHADKNGVKKGAQLGDLDASSITWRKDAKGNVYVFVNTES